MGGVIISNGYHRISRIGCNVNKSSWRDFTIGEVWDECGTPIVEGCVLDLEIKAEMPEISCCQPHREDGSFG